MKKKLDLWIYEYPILKKLMLKLKFTSVALVIGITNVLAIPSFTQTATVSPDMENNSQGQVPGDINTQSEFHFAINQLTDNPGNNSTMLKSGNNLQQIRVTGKVVDASTGEPLAGVTVQVKGTMTGAISGADGTYTVNVAQNATALVFSFVGYTSQEIAISGRASIDVSLVEEVTALDEVVVIGYGVQRKSNVTGAISQVKSADLENRSITSVNSGLQGKTSGVQVVTTSGAPGAETSIRIRGYSSNANTNPLYIVDGLRTQNISYLDPADIESMEILKDAASAAIYGAQAGNGVVLITTKRAQQGTLRIDYDMQYSIQQITHMPEALQKKEYLQYLVVEGNLVSQARVDQFYDGTTDTDWSKVAFENGAIKRHNVSFQGANAQGSVYGFFLT
jgi:TonB-dependent SusC/RagA subfamily outer membrane receptor